MPQKSGILLRPLLIGCLIGGQCTGNCADEISVPNHARITVTKPVSDTMAFDKLPKWGDLTPPKNTRKSDGAQEPPILRLDEIQVYGTVDPEDIKKANESPIAKLRTFLYKNGKSHIPTFTESIGTDGSRAVRVITAGRTYWIEESRGQVDWLDFNKKRIATNCWGGCR